MKYDWSDLETFQHTGKKFGDPIISIYPNKTIKLSNGFMRHARTQLSNKTHVILSFSKENNAIVFKFTEKNGVPGELKISIGAGFLISSKPFFNYFMIDTEKYQGKYMPSLENIPGMGDSWVIYLDRKYA